MEVAELLLLTSQKVTKIRKGFYYIYLGSFYVVVNNLEKYSPNLYFHVGLMLD